MTDILLTMHNAGGALLRGNTPLEQTPPPVAIAFKGSDFIGTEIGTMQIAEAIMVNSNAQRQITHEKSFDPLFSLGLVLLFAAIVVFAYNTHQKVKAEQERIFKEDQEILNEELMARRRHIKSRHMHYKRFGTQSTR